MLLIPLPVSGATFGGGNAQGRYSYRTECNGPPHSLAVYSMQWFIVAALSFFFSAIRHSHSKVDADYGSYEAPRKSHSRLHGMS
jgi:hypothetical protein